MEAVLRHFCEISSQKVNIGKSKLYVSRNTNRVVELAISSKWGIFLTSDFGRYLGFPVTHGWISKSTYQELGSKVHRQLARWKGRYLSKAARSILMRTVTTTIPLYSMQIAKLTYSYYRKA